VHARRHHARVSNIAIKAGQSRIASMLPGLAGRERETAAGTPAGIIDVGGMAAGRAKGERWPA